MISFTRTLVLLLAAAGAILAGGCSIQSQKDSSIPWNQPASWEGQIPGMETPASNPSGH
jgi:hypothetical protein